MNTILIEMFNAALVAKSNNAAEFKTVNELATKVGYLVHPDVCGNPDVVEFLKNQRINLNSTFYKTWEDVTSKSRFELLIDQILHYATTYGTDFTCGNGYVPNDGEAPVIPFENYKLIVPITPEELYTRCVDMIYSGVALKSETTNALVGYIVDYYRNHTDAQLDVDSIKNREAFVIICDKLKLFPKKNADTLLRYIVYKTTGSVMIVRNRMLRYRIMESDHPFDMSVFSEEEKMLLAQNFLRNKEIYLAFKHNSRCNNAPVINTIRRYAKRYHKPVQPQVLSSLFSRYWTDDQIIEALDKVTLFRAISLLQACKLRLMNPDEMLYIIRNQKVYVGPNKSKQGIQDVMSSRYQHIYDVIYGYVVNELSKKACTFKMSEFVNIAAPTSEKNFVGNYPFGTSVALEPNNFVGIYWKNEWGARDFDLSYETSNGTRIGWNANHYEDGVIFSGDMTNAEPEATEILFFKEDCQDGIVNVNRYCGDVNSAYKLWIGQEDPKDNIHKGYMVNPNSIRLTVDVVSDEKQQSVALISDNRLYVMRMNTGYGCIPDGCLRMFNCYAQYVKSAIDLRQLLLDAKFTYPQTGYNTDGVLVEEEPELDLRDMTRDTLIKLFTKEA